MTQPATIGRPIRLEGLVLPGTRLEPKADPGRTAPLAVRFVEVAPHGTLLRYDLEVTVWEPGKHDVRAYLERADGSTTDDLPEIPVEAASVLAAGVPRVSTAEPVIPRDLGGYRERAIGAAAVWLAGLLAILLLLRKRRGPVSTAQVALAPADRLTELVEQLQRDERARAALDRLSAWLHAPAGEPPADIAVFVEAILPPRRLERSGRVATEAVP